jgi:uroporphyrinogen III methyltransferase/synthase
MPVSDQVASGSEKPGVVYLVGAGPGDPGLLTLRGRALLERADVVVYDYLANPALLQFARPGAEHVYVGKRAAAHTLTQDGINALLVDLGLSGKTVVRLKGGDPFVFGRGGEECEALHAAGVAFEVVPGITAAIAAPAYAGIPVTHRDFNSSFTFLTGHEKEDDYKEPESRARGAAPGSSDVDWSTVAKLPALAFYMGVKALPRICAKLIEHGMDPATPAATIRWGTRPEQRTVVGTIADLPRRVVEARLTAPAMTIVGRVVSLRDTMNWFERRPLFGQTVVVTRTRLEASDLSSRLAELGARVIEAPTIEVAPPADPAAVNAVFRRLLRTRVSDTIWQRKLDKDHDAVRRVKWEDEVGFDWIVFTSANGVRLTRRFLLDNGLDVRVLGTARVAAVGGATAAAVEAELCVRPDLVPDRAVAEALADALAARDEVAGKRFCLLRADIARPVLVERLRAGGAAEVADVPVYETRPVAALPPHLLDALSGGDVTWVTFTSSSTVRNFTALLGANYRDALRDVKLASIGPITSATMRELGLEPAVEADASDIDGVVRAIERASAKA